jgi:hypothetical protein
MERERERERERRKGEKEQRTVSQRESDSRKVGRKERVYRWYSKLRRDCGTR